MLEGQWRECGRGVLQHMGAAKTLLLVAVG